MRRTGDEVVTGVAMKPADSDGTAIVGEIIDRLGFESAVFTALFGDITGSPDPTVVPITFFHGDDSDMGDEVEVTAYAVTVTDPAAAAKQELNINLVPLKRYVRMKADPAFTGGSSPKLEIAGAYTLGQKKYGPAS